MAAFELDNKRATGSLIKNLILLHPGHFDTQELERLGKSDQRIKVPREAMSQHKVKRGGKDTTGVRNLGICAYLEIPYLLCI